MTELMQKVLVEINKLPEQEQDVFAAWILEELASETRWAELFASSQDLLSELADEALAEHGAGKTLPLNIDEL